MKAAAALLTGVALVVTGWLGWALVAAGVIGIARLWWTDRLAAAAVTGILAALAAVALIEAGSWWAAVTIAAAGICAAVVAHELRDDTDDEFAIGAHHWPLDSDR